MVYKLYYGMDTILKIIFRQDLQDLQDIFFLLRFPEETGKIESAFSGKKLITTTMREYYQIY